MSRTEAHDWAELLSNAQRRVLTSARKVRGTWRVEVDQVSVRDALYRRGLLVPTGHPRSLNWPLFGYTGRLTPMGVAVRDIVINEEES